MDHQPTTKKPIWHGSLTLEGINAWGRVNMIDHLEIAFTEIGDDYLKATMPVDHVDAARHDSASIRTA